jgi:hypothetical protein
MIEKILTERGWKRTSGVRGGCKSCGWPTYYHELHKGYKIEVYRYRNRCAILKNNLRRVARDVSGEELEKTLKELGIIS